jgi:hypothetical protein
VTSDDKDAAAVIEHLHACGITDEEIDSLAESVANLLAARWRRLVASEAVTAEVQPFESVTTRARRTRDPLRGGFAS